MISFLNNFREKLTFKYIDNGNYKILLSLIILLFLSIILNFGARYYEKTIWDKNPNMFYSDNAPILRSGDPAYYINIAKYLKENKSLVDYNEKLFFPRVIDKEYISPPVISYIISLLSKDSSLKELIKAGNNLVLLSSILTSLGIFFLFYVIGRPFEGIVASVGGGISTNYLMRSGIGYVDTDILNLFFIYSLFGFIYLSSKQKSLFKGLILIIFTGSLGKLFYLWYPKPELILISFFSLIFFTFFKTKDWKKIFIYSFMYILLTGPNLYINGFNIFIANPYLSSYLSANIQSIDLVDKTSLNFNNIFKYIGELRKPQIIDLLKVEGSIFFGLMCLSGLFLWAITYPVLFFGFAPLSLFFLLSLVLGQRAFYYSGPFMWFGLIYFINFIFFKISSFKKLEFNKDYIYVFTSFSFIALFLIINGVFNREITRPLISTNIIKALTSMNDLINEKDESIIVAPWSYGYQSLLYNDIPILIHPGSPTSPRHYFIDRAYVSFDLDETSKILNYVASGNLERINEKGIDTFQKLSKDLYSTDKIDKDIFIMLTQQQRLWMSITASVAYWDIEKSMPIKFDGLEAGEIFGISEINCDDLDAMTLTTKCADQEGSNEKYIPVNLALGLWNEEPVLKRVVQIVDGKVEINEVYKNAKGNIVFQIVKDSKKNNSQLYLMHETVFKSAYNKLFHLNDSKNYELIYDDYPNVKIYKVK